MDSVYISYDFNYNTYKEIKKEKVYGKNYWNRSWDM
jgi:hypothetical protein